MTKKRVKIADLMVQSGVEFGTSGARGLVKDMTDEVCYAYTVGFLKYLEQTGELIPPCEVALGGDYRSSSDRIMTAAAKAVEDRGYTPQSCGKVPSPTLAYYGLLKNIPTIMVTGSHIPEDRNGIKYTKKAGEILKSDEAGMKDQEVSIPDGLFDEQGYFTEQPLTLSPSDEAREEYVKRYLDFFPHDCLAGKHIGVYQHSAVGRDLMPEILSGLGAKVTLLGHSDEFIPVDTEAIRPEDIESAKEWAQENDFFAIVSTDGDSDRPLVADEKGNWLRGDVAGVLTALYLGADAVVVPVSCNSLVEKVGAFIKVFRTRIGSPYVIEQMQTAAQLGAVRVVGYEANGGFLMQSSIKAGGKVLKALPTRDAVIVHLAILLLATKQKKKIGQLLAGLPKRYTYSDRLKEFPTEVSQAKIRELYSGDQVKDVETLDGVFEEHFGKIKGLDATDGVRITFENDEIVHLRPSGNAPEFRCYTEADSEERAQEINKTCIGIMETWKQ
jgi:phosphomannomutase